MADGISEDGNYRGRHVLPWLWLFPVGGLVAAGLLVVVLVGLRVVESGSPPYRPEDASWRFGQSLMQDQLYGQIDGDVTTGCRDGIARAAGKPPGFDPDRALEGCRYAEWAYDN